MCITCSITQGSMVKVLASSAMDTLQLVITENLCTWGLLCSEVAASLEAVLTLVPAGKGPDAKYSFGPT